MSEDQKEAKEFLEERGYVSALFEGPTAVDGRAVRHSSESAEYGSPLQLIYLADHVMGPIGLDPASSRDLNERVGAERIFTREDDGFTKPWVADNVFLNPPGGLSDDQQRPVKPKCRVTGSCGLPPGHVHEGVESSQKKWWFKLACEWLRRRTSQAIFVCFSVELLQSAQKFGREHKLPTPLDFAVCYPDHRLRYWRDGAEKDQPPHASCVVYLPPLPLAGERGWRRTSEAIERFRSEFSSFGQVVVPSRRG